MENRIKFKIEKHKEKDELFVGFELREDNECVYEFFPYSNFYHRAKLSGKIGKIPKLLIDEDI